METTRAHQLRTVGLRVARPRSPVLDVWAARPHAAADAIATAAREHYPTLAPKTVYGVLEVPVAVGLARRIAPAGNVRVRGGALA
jgi:Fe2+ or Zn2+ uptake regulation protein